MADEPLDKNITRELVDSRNQEFRIKSRELDIVDKGIDARQKDLDNQKEIALKTIEAHVKNSEQEQQALTTESTKQKIFIVTVILIVLGFMWLFAQNGHVGVLYEIIKLVAVALGGSGITIIYFMKRRNAD